MFENRRRKIYTANCPGAAPAISLVDGDVDFMPAPFQSACWHLWSALYFPRVCLLTSCAGNGRSGAPEARRAAMASCHRVAFLFGRWRNRQVGLKGHSVAVLVHFPCNHYDQQRRKLRSSDSLDHVAMAVYKLDVPCCYSSRTLLRCCAVRASPIIAPLAERSRYHSEDSDDEDPLVHMDEDMQELLETITNEAFNVDVVISPSLYTSFEASKHPVFGAEIRMRQSLAKAYRIQRDAENRQAMRQKAKDDALDEAIRRQRERAKNAKLRLNKYVKHMTKKNAKRRGFKQEKPARRQQHDEDANNFIV